MKITLNWLQNVAFAADNGRGSQIVFDGPPEYGGKDQGMRPMEGVLSGAAACSAFDIVQILKKSRQTLHTLAVEVEAARDSSPPGVFTRIHLHFLLSGELRDSAVARAVSLSVEKYCSALAMLNKTAEITHSWAVKN